MLRIITAGFLVAHRVLGVCEDIDATASGRVVHIESVQQIQPSLNDASSLVICLALNSSQQMCV